MSSLLNFMERWKKKFHYFDYDGISGDDTAFKSFARGFGICLRNDCKTHGIEVLKVTRGHFDVSARVRRKSDGKMFFIAIPDVRSRHSIFEKVLFREVKDENDHVGGMNRWAFLDSIPRLIEGA